MGEDKPKISNRSTIHYKYTMKNYNDFNRKEKTVNFFDVFKKHNRKTVSSTKQKNFIIKKTVICDDSDIVIFNKSDEKSVDLLQNLDKNFNCIRNPNVHLDRKVINRNIKNNNIDVNLNRRDGVKNVDKIMHFLDTDCFIVNEESGNTFKSKNLMNEKDKEKICHLRHSSCDLRRLSTGWSCNENLVKMELDDLDGEEMEENEREWKQWPAGRLLMLKRRKNKIYQKIPDLKRLGTISPDIVDYAMSQRGVSFSKGSTFVEFPLVEAKDKLIYKSDVVNENGMKTQFLEKLNAEKVIKSKEVTKTSFSIIDEKLKAIKRNESENDDDVSGQPEHKTGKVCKCNGKTHEDVNTIGCKFEFSYAIPSMGFFKSRNSKKKLRMKKCSRCKKNKKNENEYVRAKEPIKTPLKSSLSKRGTVDLNYVECFYENNGDASRISNKQYDNNNDDDQINDNVDKNEDVDCNIGDIFKNNRDNFNNLFHGNSCDQDEVNGDNRKGLNDKTVNHSRNKLNYQILFKNYENCKEFYHGFDHQVTSNDLFSNRKIISNVQNVKAGSKKLNLSHNEDGILGSEVISKTKMSDSLLIYPAGVGLTKQDLARRSFHGSSTSLSSANKNSKHIEIKESAEFSFDDFNIRDDSMDDIMDGVFAVEDPEEFKSKRNSKGSTIKFDKQPTCFERECNEKNFPFVSIYVNLNDLNHKLTDLEDHMKGVLDKHRIHCEGLESNDDKPEDIASKKSKSSLPADATVIVSNVEIKKIEEEKENYSCQIKESDNSLTNDKYVITKSESDPHTLCIKPPQMKDYRSCNCCNDEGENCYCIRIDTNKTKNKNTVVSETGEKMCIDNQQNVSPRTDEQSNRNGANDFLTKLTNCVTYFADNFLFYDNYDEDINCSGCMYNCPCR